MAKALLRLFTSILSWSLIFLHIMLIAVFCAACMTLNPMFSEMFRDTMLAIGANVGVWAANKHFSGEV